MGQPAEHLPLSQIPRPALAVRVYGLPRYRPIRPVQGAVDAASGSCVRLIYRDPSEPSGGGGGSGERWLIRGAADQGGCARPRGVGPAGQQ